MPSTIAVDEKISVCCMRCRHRGWIDAAALGRLGLKADAPISSFVKRLRCSKCGSGSVMAKKSRADEPSKLRRA